MSLSPYRGFLNSEIQGDLVHRDISCDDQVLAQALARALKALWRGPLEPVTQGSPSNRLQGNLCEFCAWELGANLWRLYPQSHSWPANAKNPWFDQSRSGIDILAFDPVTEILLVVEVKSSRGDGAAAISSEDDSLRADFRHLFDGDPRNRLTISIAGAVSDLVLRGEPELAWQVKATTGHKPDECDKIRLVGILVCQSGQNMGHANARFRAFSRLQGWLSEQGWLTSQMNFRSVELCDFSRWLAALITEATQ